MNETAVGELYPTIEPYARGYLPASQGHEVYFEQSGCPQGVPVVFLHGGPGSGCGPRHRQFFNPSRVRAVLFDQRGCGRSQSSQPLHANTSLDLVADIERLREHLGIDRWLVVGGSWGGGLGVAYASQHPQRCLGAVLRSVFLARPEDVDWFFWGARQYLPDAWAALAPTLFPQGVGMDAPIYQRLLTMSDTTALPLAMAWHDWEHALTSRHWDGTDARHASHPAAAQLLARYRLQSHYLQHDCFFPRDGLLAHVQPMRDMPVSLVHGRLDWICRPEAAWELHQHLPNSQLQWVDDAGHSPFEAAMTPVWVGAIDCAVAQACG